jgi:hypothetical protein
MGLQVPIRATVDLDGGPENRACFKTAVHGHRTIRLR